MSRSKAESHQRLLDHQEQQYYENPGDNLRPIAPTLPTSSASSTVSTTPRVPTPKPLPRQKSLPQQQFVEEIDYNEIDTEEVVGKGSFGVVWRGKWRGRDVAIKHINTEGERRAFAVEVRQLSRVSHPNIVRLYGACTKNPVCLVMEYAEGGSLYNVLHGEPKTHYTAGHAISWALQCAQGVAYLHNMKPKPLIHRDLKPPNLLLINSGRTLKICDFGTACDLNTYMTNNKGSAAWMAPEVFEGSRYTEKCDVFSWGVILWEILTRRKPFDDIGGSAYRIMWAVHTGQRPPLIEGCPQPIENLITKCWHKIPDERPSMNEIVHVMTILAEFFTGQDDPIEYRNTPSPILNDEELNDEDDDTIDVTWNTNSSQLNGDPEINCVNVDDKTVQVNQASEIQNVQQTPQPAVRTSTSKSAGQNSTFQPLHIECDQNAWELTASTDSSWELQNMAGLDKMGRKTKKPIDRSETSSSDHLDNVYRLLDPELRPLTPDNTCELSRDIFEEHKQLAQEYLKVQTEIALVSQCKSNMLKNLSADGIRQQQELRKLEDEKESLVKLYRNLKRQLEILKGQRRPMTIFNPSTSMNSGIPGDDGWICVPRHEPSRIS